MVSNELVLKLCSEATGRFARFHSTPSNAAITVDEMYALTEQYPTGVILEAMTRTASVMKKDPTLDHSRVLRAVQNIAERVLKQNAMGKNMHRKVQGTVEPPAPNVSTLKHETTEEDITELQRIFAYEIGDKTLETFTLHPEECTALLAKKSLSDLTGLCQAVGNWVWESRTKSLRFHDQNTVVDELFRRARVPQPEVVTT